MQFNIHNEFQLNGNSFHSKKELLIYLKINTPIIFSFVDDFLNDSSFISMKTSGSTGKPKMIEIKKEFMVNSAYSTGEFFNLTEGTTALLCMNPEYIAGKMMLVRAMLLGWELDVVAQSLNPLSGVEKEYDFSAMVPLQVYNSINELRKVKKLIVGGGVVSNELKLKLQNIKTEVFATYGMTETVTHIAIKRLNVVSINTQNPSYKVLPNIRISKDVRDCLIIDAPRVSINTIITNDVVEILSENEFYWLGRYDSVINSGGIKLIPEVIEENFSEIIKNRFFIAGIPDAELGEKIILIIEGKEDITLKGKLKTLKTVTKYEFPKAIYFVEKFVETETKKIQRKKTMNLLF